MSCKRTERCVGWLKRAAGSPGDVIELGVYRGQTTIALARYLKSRSINKKVYSCDTFGGLPYNGISTIDPQLKKGECRAELSAFLKRVEAAGVQDYVIPIVGMVEDTLYKQLANKKWCFAFLDMDLYKPTSFGVKYLTPRMSKGAVMGFHDYRYHRCPGIQKVVDTEVNRKLFDLYPDFNSNCAFFIRRK